MSGRRNKVFEVKTKRVRQPVLDDIPICAERSKKWNHWYPNLHLQSIFVIGASTGRLASGKCFSSAQERSKRHAWKLSIFPWHQCAVRYLSTSSTSVCANSWKKTILTYRQHGFCRGYSCGTQLVSVVNDRATSLNSSVRTDVAIFDFPKAFYSVPHRRLHAKLQSYGINGHVLAWITAFLSNRCQRVTLKGGQSSWKSVTSGVPQGTVLGPLLFLIHINDIVENLSLEICLFADDCTLYREIGLPADNLALQKYIDTLHSWSLLWQMSFNTKKCHTVVHFTKTR